MGNNQTNRMTQVNQTNQATQYTNESAKQVFESLITLGKQLPYPYVLSTLETKAQQSLGVCRTSYSRSYDKEEYSEELIVDFKNGTCITATLVSNIYYWDLIPSKGSNLVSLSAEIPL